MSNEMIPTANAPEIAPTETLEQLAQRANVAHMRAIETVYNAVEHAVEAGQVLLEAKRRCPPGTWHAWLNQHFRGSIRTAQGYMRLAIHAPQIDYDAHGRAHLTYDQVRCMLTGLAAADGRAKSARKRRAAIETPAVPPSPTPEQRLCGDPVCLPIVQVDADLHNVAESLLQTLHELAELSGNPTEGKYAFHLFERLRLVYFGLANQQWFHEWPVNKTT